ncbi:Acidic endochitinase [Dichanthelium oligosanthes]|uniref:Acidic endochitinase n=1 Tax=Dichanthelium oligosanthes TaxID=888268 RepID=A0A1E5VPM0_9POAL|nr:Acidic endochitinase [Dichanthelium oligosanthes]
MRRRRVTDRDHPSSCSSRWDLAGRLGFLWTHRPGLWACPLVLSPNGPISSKSLGPYRLPLQLRPLRPLLLQPAPTSPRTSTRSCQSMGVRVMPSIGGGHSDKRPLGDAVLDGVDFDIEGGNPDHYGALAAYLRSYGGKGSSKEVYLSAAPFTQASLTMSGFSSTTTRLASTRRPGAWPTSSTPEPVDSRDQCHRCCGERLHTSGEPQIADAAGSGFIPVGSLKSQVLPAMKNSTKYGGVMLWSKFYDEQDGYSSAIKNSV